MSRNHGWSKHGSSIIPSKHSIPQDLYSPRLNLNNYARTMFTPTMFLHRQLMQRLNILYVYIYVFIVCVWTHEYLHEDLQRRSATKIYNTDLQRRCMRMLIFRPREDLQRLQPVRLDGAHLPAGPYYTIDIHLSLSLYIYIYMYVYVYMYMCVHIYIYIYVYVYVHVCIYTYVYTCIYIYIYIYIRIYVYTYIYMYI